MLAIRVYPAAVAIVLLASLPSFAQPGGWGGDRGGWGGDRGGFGGDRGNFGGFRGPDGGFRGGPGGFPGGGFPGGGFFGGDPRDMARRADTNNNNMLEPDELQNGYGRPVRFMAERAGLNVNQALRVDEVVAGIERSRGMSSGTSSSSGSPSSVTATTNPQAFGTQTQAALVPGFDAVPTTPGAPGAAATSNLPLEQRIEPRVLERAQERIRDLDRNGNGTLEGEELANYRGDPPILMSDLNKDNIINLEEMALRYQSRYGSSSYGPGGPSGYPGSPGSSSGYPGSSSSSSSYGYRPPMMMSTSSSPSSSSSSGDRTREFAERIFRSSDRNNSGKIEREEWGNMRDPESTDANKDGVITMEEMVARMQSRMSGGDRGGGDRGGSDRDRDRGGGDRDRGGGDRDRDRGSFGDRGGFGGGPPGGFSRGGPPGGFGGDRGGFGGGPPGGGFGDRGGFGGGPPGGGFGGDRGGFSSRGGSDRGGFGGDRGSFGGDRGSSRGSDSRGASSSSGNGSSDPAAPKRSYRVATATELLPRGLDSWFTRSDTDGDGQVSMSEYAAKWDPEVAKKFQQFDANNDGFISANEALQAAPSSSRR